MTPFQKVEATAKRLGYGSYYGYLRSEHWKELKESRLRGALCCVCGRKNPRVAHHKQYRGLIDVTVDDLEPMCMTCHDIFHLACRREAVDYIGLCASQIKSVTETYKATDEFQRREAKRIAKCQAINYRRMSKKDRNKMALRFKQFLRSKITTESLNEFCGWLSKEVAPVLTP